MIASQAAISPPLRRGGGARSTRRPAMGAATSILLLGLFVTYVAALAEESVNGLFSISAWGLAVTLVLSFMVDCRGAAVRLIRVDLFMLAALYGLTFFEFLFEQPAIRQASLASAKLALLASYLGFAGIGVGRHLVPMRRALPDPRNLAVSPRLVFRLLLLSSVLGYVYMLLSVGFNPVEMVEQMMRPRFSQPWTRGRLGGPSALLAELSLIKAAIPALCALILAQRRRFSRGKIAVALFMGLFVLFDGYSSGTRNVFLLYFVTFLATYFLFAPRMSTTKLLVIGTACAITAFVAMTSMLATRGNLQAGLVDLQINEPVFVDMNLVNIARLTDVFPARRDYLGLEIPYNMIIRPIPRALWAGKPEGLSVGIEKALGVGDYMTLSATFVGEFWMAGGMGAVALGSFALGAITAFWNRYGARADNQMKLIIYLVGFFPAGLCMRSFLGVAPAILPILALFVLQKKNKKKSRL